ncbi:Rod binding protein [Geosporobacter subterraneus DSM 17957]|uniref:Rod binding protein n=1 Tax=Geosporobacter subterraneus DSM 17957 TaxID=1121919 RepID=A0A1M6CIY5_9FIRM|nr:rod-binding protein [Geosporobacter subterraneus]SHI60873.1 Rod binding protein [Geosporobacter subterraneus DSM 17957]
MKIDGNLPIHQVDIKNKKEEVKTEEFKNLLEQAQKSQDEKKLMDACRQFESVFINMLLKNMRNSIPEGGFIEKSYPREIFEGMFDEKMADEVSKGQGIGLAKQMYSQLSRTMKIKKIDGEE